MSAAAVESAARVLIAAQRRPTRARRRLELLRRGASTAEISAELGIASTSSVFAPPPTRPGVQVH